jgi:hypothetical protein
VAGLFASVLLTLLALGCTCSKEREAPQKPEQPPERAEPELPKTVDPALLSELKRAAEECKQGPNRIVCPGKSKNAITSEFNRGKRSKTTALPTFSYALSLGDEKLSTLAAAVLYGAYRLGLGTNQQPEPSTRPSKQTARELLGGVLSLAPQASMQAIPAAVHAMWLTNQGDSLREALQTDLPIQVRTMALRYLMVYGRLNVFPEIERAAIEPRTAIVLAAVESPRNMRQWSEEERAKICPWLRGFLDDERDAVVGSALAGLSQCDTEDIDALLDQASQAASGGQFSFVHSTALRNLCGRTGQSRGSLANSEQCKEVRKLQEQVARNNELQARVRAMNLSNLAYDFPDEESLSLARELAKSESPEVKAAAEQSVKRIEQQLPKP